MICIKEIEIRITTVLLLGLALTACGGLTKKSALVDYGMNKSDVVGMLGYPDRRSMRAKSEALQYMEIVGFGQCSYITVWLTSGVVQGVTSRSGPSVAGCGLGAKEVDWGQIPKPEMNINISNK